LPCHNPPLSESRHVLGSDPRIRCGNSPPFDREFPGEDPNLSIFDQDSAFPAVNNFERNLTETVKKDVLSRYDAGIAYMDSEIGHFPPELRNGGLYDNSLIIVMSDQGNAFGEHHLVWHAVAQVYEELVHVPLLVKYPGQRQGRQATALVGEVDLTPTVLDVTAITGPPGVQGRSMRQEPSDETAPVFAEAQVIPLPLRKHPRFRGIRRAIFWGSSKYINWTGGLGEFYDLSVDPSESRNSVQDPRAAPLPDRLKQWIAGIPARTGIPIV
jgi:arylsulfatase A-like enzyme